MRTRFDDASARGAVDFFAQRLVHTKGRFAGQPFVLEPWQADRIIRPLFGEQVLDAELDAWVRRYRTAYVEIPRKNGKSEIGAGVGLKLTFADGERGAEVYSVAEDLDQANVVFGVARAMVEANPGLAKRARVYKRLIEVPKTGNVYRVIPGDAAGAHGQNAHGVVFDELHTQANRELWDVMTSSQGTRAQPLVFAMSTAGFDRQSICWEQHEYGEQVAKATVTDPSFFYLRFGLAEVAQGEQADDWQDEDIWRRCNPALGSFLRMSFLRSEYAKAKASPARQNTFRRLYLNEWTSAESRWFDLAAWDACGGLAVPEQLAGQTCFGGLDLASVGDFTAWVLWFPEAKTVLARFFLPRSAVERRSAMRDTLAGWERNGYLTVTDGDVLDDAAVEAQIDADARAFRIREVGYDRWNAVPLILRLADKGLVTVPVSQGIATLNRPAKELERRVLARELNHGGHPVLRWMADNCQTETDSAGNIKPSKKRSREKIDGIVATLNALERALAADPPPPRSVYEDRDVEVI